MPKISWGVDGHGNKHYICDYCELEFGKVDPDNIVHECDTSKPRYHNRGVYADQQVTQGDLFDLDEFTNNKSLHCE